MNCWKTRPEDKSSTRLQELSLMNNTYFGAIHYDILLDMKLIYTISRLFQKLSLSELEMLHHLCELGRTQTSQSVALAILKIPYAGYLLSGNRSNFIDCEGNMFLSYVLVNVLIESFQMSYTICSSRYLIFGRIDS